MQLALTVVSFGQFYISMLLSAACGFAVYCSTHYVSDD